MSHWTARSVVDFTYRLSSDFMLQIETKMEQGDIKQSEVAQYLGVSDGRVSQVFRNPGNMTLKNMVEYGRSVGMKVSVVAYEDSDPTNENGPINSEIFNLCWQRAGKPSDFRLFSTSEITQLPEIVHVYTLYKHKPQISEGITEALFPVWMKAKNSNASLIEVGS